MWFNMMLWLCASTKRSGFALLTLRATRVPVEDVADRRVGVAKGEITILCAQMLNWVLKLFSHRDIMSKVRIANSGNQLAEWVAERLYYLIDITTHAANVSHETFHEQLCIRNLANRRYSNTH
jgi:hypothetical protein